MKNQRYTKSVITHGDFRTLLYLVTHVSTFLSCDSIQACVCLCVCIELVLINLPYLRRAGSSKQYKEDPSWRDLLLFHEFFDGESGRGCGASHQTGWTSLVANCINITLGYSHAGLGRYSFTH